MSHSFKADWYKYQDTRQFSELICKYLDDNPEIKPFFRHSPRMESFGKVLEAHKNIPVNRAVLVEVLRKQYAQMKGDAVSLVLQNVSKLGNENTFTVTTGHQLCLFTGPLYFIYKIISTINLAKSLSKTYPENVFIPVYWMASEDHDFEEINHIHVFSKKLKWEQNQGGATGKLNTASLQTFFDEWSAVIGDSPLSEELKILFRQAYMNTNNLADAMRHLVHGLFGKDGLVILDADDALLKREFIPVMKDDLIHQHAYKLVTDVNLALAAFTKIQVVPREINLFLMDDGMRNRIVKSGDKRYSVLNTEQTFSENELLELLEIHPEKFSPNVVLRPLYQETILPNLAYIGGPGEISYWLQYLTMFDFYKVPFPILVLRNCVTLLEKDQLRKWQELGYSKSDIFRSVDELMTSFIESKTAINDVVSLEEEKQKFVELFESLRAKASSEDPTLSAFVNAEFQKIQNTLTVLEQKMSKSQKKKHEVSLNQMKSIKEKLFPGLVPQERHYNFSMFYLKYGSDFFKILFEYLDPLNLQYLVLTEE